ncbi:MAG: tetratricopeptide repeat protein [Caldilineaceae bacterium]
MNTGFPSVVLFHQKRSVVLDCLLLAVCLFILSACQANGILIKPQATTVAPTLTQDQSVLPSSSIELPSDFCPENLTFATGFAAAQADETLVVVSDFADSQGNDPHKLTQDLVGRMRERLSTYPNIRVEQLNCAISPQAGSETALRIGSRKDVQATIMIWGVYTTPAESTVRINFKIVKEQESYLGAGFDRSLGPQAIQPSSFNVEADLGTQMNEMVAFTSGMVLVNANEHLAAELLFDSAISTANLQQASGFVRFIHLYRGVNDLYLGRSLDAISELEPLQPSQTVTGEALDPLDLPILNALGLAYSASGSKQKALEHFDQALALYQLIGDKAGEAKVLNGIGLTYSSYGEMQKALEHFDQAMPLYETLGDKAGKAWVLSNIGDVYAGLDEIQKTLEYYEQALPLYKAMDNKAGEARALTMLGLANSFLGEKELALKYYEQALPLHKAMGNEVGEAMILNNIGDIYSGLSEEEKALEYYEQALPLYQSMGNKTGEASTLAKVGKAYSDQGEIQKALEYYDQAIPLYQAAGDTAGEASIFTQIGNFFFSKGDWQKAIEYYEQAIPLYQLAGDKASEASTLTMIANSYSTLENSQKAIESMNNVVGIYHSIGDSSSEVKALDWLAVLQFLHNDLDGAAATLEIAIDLATEIDHPMLPMLQGLLDEINAKRNE